MRWTAGRSGSAAGCKPGAAYVLVPWAGETQPCAGQAGLVPGEGPGRGTAGRLVQEGGAQRGGEADVALVWPHGSTAAANWRRRRRPPPGPCCPMRPSRGPAWALPASSGERSPASDSRRASRAAPRVLHVTLARTPCSTPAANAGCTCSGRPPPDEPEERERAAVPERSGPERRGRWGGGGGREGEEHQEEEEASAGSEARQGKGKKKAWATPHAQ